MIAAPYWGWAPTFIGRALYCVIGMPCAWTAIRLKTNKQKHDILHHRESLQIWWGSREICFTIRPTDDVCSQKSLANGRWFHVKPGNRAERFKSYFYFEVIWFFIYIELFVRYSGRNIHKTLSNIYIFNSIYNYRNTRLRSRFYPTKHHSEPDVKTK